MSLSVKKVISNTHCLYTPMVKSRDILRDKSLGGPTSLLTTTLDGVTSSLLLRNIRNKRESVRYSQNKLNGKHSRSVQDG